MVVSCRSHNAAMSAMWKVKINAYSVRSCFHLGPIYWLRDITSMSAGSNICVVENLTYSRISCRRVV